MARPANSARKMRGPNKNICPPVLSKILISDSENPPSGPINRFITFGVLVGSKLDKLALAFSQAIKLIAVLSLDALMSDSLMGSVISGT